MSEIKLNLLDSHSLLIATVHGSVGDALVAALSAEPETIDELESALKRFEKCESILASSLHRRQRGEIDEEPWDAGIVVIDLAARIVASESTYSIPTRQGTVAYHDGSHSTGFPVSYLLPDDWLFVRSIANYQARCDQRVLDRENTPPLDTREILYGESLREFIVKNVQLLRSSAKPNRSQQREAVVDIHRRWLTTPRHDLNGHSPRQILFAKRDLIDFDLTSRSNQWSYFLEEPPALSRESHAYRFAGYGTHEWVMYYYLVRFLIWEAVDQITELQLHDDHLATSVTSPLGPPSSARDHFLFTQGIRGEEPHTISICSGEENTEPSPAPFGADVEPSKASLMAYLAQRQTHWLSEPNRELDGYIPAEVIDNERRRRPEAMTGRSMVIDENCPCCKMMGDESEAGLGIYFCHFDGCNMEDEFAFSWCATLKEWNAEQRELKKLHSKWERERDERDVGSADFDDDEIPF